MSGEIKPTTTASEAVAHHRTCSALFERLMASEQGDELMHKVWDNTPWMMDAFTGAVNSTRWHLMNEWCRENYGPEAWPIHGKPGQWHRGGATIHGWTWFGFATEAMMTYFAESWPNAKVQGTAD